MDQSYQQSINSILMDMGLIEAKMAAIDAAAIRSATNLAAAAQKLNAATPNDMKDVISGNTKAVDQFSAAIQKANILQIKYEQEKEKLGKVQAQRLAAEETLKSKIQKNEIAASEQIIKQKQKEAAILDAAQTKAISRTQQQINIEKQALAESIKLTQQKQVLEAKLETERERQSTLQLNRIIKLRKEEERLAKAADAELKKKIAEEESYWKKRIAAEQAAFNQLVQSSKQRKQFHAEKEKEYALLHKEAQAKKLLRDLTVAEVSELKKLYQAKRELAKEQKYFTDQANKEAAIQERFKSIYGATGVAAQKLKSILSNFSESDGKWNSYADALTRTKKEMAGVEQGISKLTKVSFEEQMATQKVAGAYDRLNKERIEAKKTLQDMIVVHGRNNAEVKKAIKDYAILTSRLNAANQAQSQFAAVGSGPLSKAFGSVGRGVSQLMAAFGLIGGLYLFADMVKQGFILAKRLDSISFAMKTVITDSNELARTQAFLADITERYGAEIVTTTERYNKFLAAAKQSNVSLDDTEKIFGTMTKAAGALGLKADELEGIFLALEQMLSKGKVTTEELRRQLGERLPGAFGIMAKALGVTTSQLDKMLRAGEVLSSEALPKFSEAVEDAYGIQNLDRVENLNAATTRMSNAWVSLIGNITKSEGTVSKAIIGITNSLTKLLNVFEMLNETEADAANTGKNAGASDFAKYLKDEIEVWKEINKLRLKAMSDNGEMAKVAKEESDELKRIAKERLDFLESMQEDYSARLADLKAEAASENEDNVLMGALTFGGDTMGDKIRDAQINTMTEMVSKYKEMIKQATIAKEAMEKVGFIDDFEELNAKLLETEEKYVGVVEKIKEYKDSDIDNPERLLALEIEEVKVKSLLDQYTKLYDNAVEFNTKPGKPFFDEKLKDAQTRYNETSPGDDAGRKAIQAEMDILKEALEIWEGAPKRKKAAIDKMKDYSAEDAFGLTEGRLERELKKQEEIRDNQENSLSERLDAEREASVKEIELLTWRKNEAVKLAGNRTDLIKNINEQFYADLMEITIKGEDRIEQIQGQDFDKRLAAFDKITAANKFAMEKEVENVRDIGIRRGWTQKYIEEQVLMIRETYAKKQLEDQIEYAIRELEAFAGTADQKIEIEERLLDLRKQLNDLSVKGLPKGEDPEVKTWKERVEAAQEYIDAVRDIAGQLGALFGTMAEARISKIDEQIEANARLHETQLENEHLTAEQREDLMLSQKKKEDELNEKKRKEKIRQAQAEKKFAIFDILINTAMNMTEAFPNAILMALAATLGALQVATVVSTPVPKYAKGRRGGKEEYAWIGDGGKREPVLDRYKQLKYISPDKPVVTKLEHGDTVLSDESKLKAENLREWLKKPEKERVQISKTVIDKLEVKPYTVLKIQNNSVKPVKVKRPDADGEKSKSTNPLTAIKNIFKPNPEPKKFVPKVPQVRTPKELKPKPVVIQNKYPKVPAVKNKYDNKYLTTENIFNDYHQITNATISTTLANSRGNMDAEKLARVFDSKLSNFKKEVRDGIKDGFAGVKLPANNGNKELADRLKFLNMRDAL